MAAIPRSRGAGLFTRIGSTQTELARKLDVSTGIVAMWQSGQRVPGLPNRKLLLERYKIPIEAWDQPADAAPSMASPASKGEPWGEGVVGGRIVALERLVDGLMREIDAPGDSTPHERAKVMTSLGHTLNTLRRLKGEDVGEARVARHPKWVELRRAILDALDPHPDALDDVIAAIEMLEKAG